MYNLQAMDFLYLYGIKAAIFGQNEQKMSFCGNSLNTGMLKPRSVWQSERMLFCTCVLALCISYRDDIMERT